MNMQWIDWTIVTAVMGLLTVMAFVARRYTKSVADFLVANRLAGRYLILVAQGAVAFPAVTALGCFEQTYETGFAPAWLGLYSGMIPVFLAISGWVVYRYRETRVMTLGQFFEIRYNKKYRIFAGMVAWGCGIVNFGVFPAVASRFFIYFCGFPETVNIFGIDLTSQAVVMFIIISIALFFTFFGGQIAVIITDFLQGVFCNIGLVVVLAYFFWRFDWSVITETVINQPAGKSLVNAFDTTKLPSFNIWFFLISQAMSFYYVMSWQGGQAYPASAKNAHEYRMSQTLANFRGWTMGLFFMFVPICAYVFMNHPSFATQSAEVTMALDAVGAQHGEVIVKQIRVPMALGRMLPMGIMGLFCALILAAFVSTNDTYLHSWGSIFVQDVILPFRKKPFTPKRHILLLRLSICFVALFIFFFGLKYRMTQEIFMFFAITGAIYLGGVGAAIIGGLYWSRGTTAGAFTAMVFGSTASIGTLIARHIRPEWFEGRRIFTSKFMELYIVVACIVLYIVVSLLTGRRKFNLERMLHRGKYALKDEKTSEIVASKGWKAFFGTHKLSTRDIVTFAVVIGWVLICFIVFVVGTVYHFKYGISDEGWSKIWQIYTYSLYGLGIIVTIWFLTGGLRDLRDLFRQLKVAKRDDADDGMVVGHHSRDEEAVE